MLELVGGLSLKYAIYTKFLLGMQIWRLLLYIVYWFIHVFVSGAEFSRVKKFAVKGGAVVDPESGDDI